MASYSDWDITHGIPYIMIHGEGYNHNSADYPISSCKYNENTNSYSIFDGTNWNTAVKLTQDFSAAQFILNYTLNGTDYSYTYATYNALTTKLGTLTNDVVNEIIMYGDATAASPNTGLIPGTVSAPPFLVEKVSYLNSYKWLIMGQLTPKIVYKKHENNQDEYHIVDFITYVSDDWSTEEWSNEVIFNDKAVFEELPPQIRINCIITSTPSDARGYMVGDTIEWKYTIVNNSPNKWSGTNIIFTDKLSGDEWTIDSFGYGDVIDLYTGYTVTDADGEAGSVSILNDGLAFSGDFMTELGGYTDSPTFIVEGDGFENIPIAYTHIDKPIPITIHTYDMQKTYDGLPLVNHNGYIEYTGSDADQAAFVNQYCSLYYTGSQTAVGSSPNYASLNFDVYNVDPIYGQWTDWDFNITSDYGTLTVINPPAPPPGPDIPEP